MSLLVPNARNARTHSTEQVGQIASSMREWGWTNPVLVDEEGGIIAGHGRVLAAAQLGFVDVPVMVAVGWSDAQKRAYALADNQLALNAGWDLDVLAEEVRGLKDWDFDLSLLGFDNLDALLARGAGLTDPDEAPPLPDEPVSKPGDVWLLGRHRLVCGDSTDADTVAQALNGVAPHLMVTDPPYGVKLDPAWRDRAGIINRLGKAHAGGEHYMESGALDVEVRWDKVWALAPVDVFYIWCADRGMFAVNQALVDHNFETRQVIVWDKGILTLTRTHYWCCHEFCLYGVRKGKTASWVGASGQSSVWQIPSPKHIMAGSKEKNEPHPAQKPVECMKRPIENNSSPGQAVYEPFSGSGTTIIAAEMTGRACYAIELSPAYVDVAVLRWQAFSGGTATLESDGRAFGG